MSQTPMSRVVGKLEEQFKHTQTCTEMHTHNNRLETEWKGCLGQAERAANVG